MDKRYIKTSVTNFLYCEDSYLFLLRNKNKKVDPGRLNGIGGKVEPGENYLDAAIRETEEETGYKVTRDDIALAAVARLEGGYDEDWVMCFFKIKIHDKKIPLGNETNDGTLMWINKDEVLKTKHELVDDIKYSFEEIVKGDKLLFINAQLDENQKVAKTSISTLNK